MSIRKGFAEASDIFSATKLASMETALESYIKTLQHLLEQTGDSKTEFELGFSQNALAKVKKLYAQTGLPKINP